MHCNGRRKIKALIYHGLYSDNFHAWANKKVISKKNKKIKNKKGEKKKKLSEWNEILEVVKQREAEDTTDVSWEIGSLVFYDYVVRTT